MKKLLITLLFFLSITWASAQYVLIPDTSFGSLLHIELPNCVIGSSNAAWLLDTTCSKLNSLTDLEIYNSTIASLEGVQYLRSLSTLYFSGGGISHVPALPPNLQSLNCALNYLDSLPSLPNSLTYLNCEVCNLYTLPTLPASLKFLLCQENHLSNLPNIPDGLTYLGCAQNVIVTLPTLPNSLRNLDCRSNQLTSLPTLPDTLVSLNCSSNPNLDCMPYLGVVQSLYFANTAISCFPDTPKDNTSITETLPICTVSCTTTTSVSNMGFNDSNISVYPNPTDTKLKVEFENSASNNSLKIAIMNTLGQVVIEQNSTLLGGNEIDVSRLNPGLYFVEVQNDKESWLKKFIKE